MGTSVLLDAIGEVGYTGECGGVGEGVGGEGGLGAAGESGDDVLLTCPHEGAGQPDGTGGGVAFAVGDYGWEVAGCIGL